MAAHAPGCVDCCGGDKEIIASINEGLLPDELADHIAGAHDPRWRTFLNRNR
jgi:hypothetical protein